MRDWWYELLKGELVRSSRAAAFTFRQDDDEDRRIGIPNLSLRMRPAPQGVVGPHLASGVSDLASGWRLGAGMLGPAQLSVPQRDFGVES